MLASGDFIKRMKLTIGKLAKQSGVTIETLRHYQRIGLLGEPEKPLSGYRHYPDDAVSRLRFTCLIFLMSEQLLINRPTDNQYGQCDYANKGIHWHPYFQKIRETVTAGTIHHQVGLVA